MILKIKNKRQKGVATIEFALVFTVVFAVFWGIVSYTAPLVLLNTMNRATAEAARLVPSVSVADEGTYEARVKAIIEPELTQQLAWLPAGWRAPIQSDVDLVGGVLSITLTYPGYATNPIIQPLSLPGLGTIPKLPVNLTATAKLTP